jgi:hypothetical protein
MQLTQLGITNTFPHRSPLEIEVIWGIGDSHSVRREPTGATQTYDLTAIPVYNWQVGATVPFKITTGDIQQTGVGANAVSFWPQYGIDRYAATGRMIVFVTTGLGGSNYAPRTGDTGDWTDADVLWSNAKDAYDDCIAYLTANYPTATIYPKVKAILGVNDAVGTTPLATIQSDITAFYDRFDSQYPGLEVGIVLPGREPAGISTARLTAVRSYLINEARNRANVYIVGTEAHFWSAGYYDTDDWHLTMAGNVQLAHMCDRWDRNTGYDEWARAIIACHFDDLSSARKTLIETWRTAIGTDYFDLEYFHLFKTTQSNNIFNSWILLTSGANPANAPSFTANSFITTNGTNQYYLTGHVESVNNIRATGTDFFDGVKVVTNRTPAGTVTYALGAGNSGPSSQTIIAQNASSQMLYRAHDVASSTYATDTRIQDDTFYATYRNGTTKGLWKNGASVATATQAAAVNPGVNKIIGALLNNATPQNFMNADFGYILGGQFTTVSLSTVYSACEALYDNW